MATLSFTTYDKAGVDAAIAAAVDAVGSSTLLTIPVTGPLVYDPPAGDGVTTVVFAQDATGGHAITMGASVVLAVGASWAPATGPGSESVAVFRPRLGGWVCEGCWTSVSYSSGSGDITPPAPGALSASNVSNTSFTLTVTGAADAVGLHAEPYSFSTDGGTTYGPWQASPTLNVTGKTASTAYTCQHITRDAAGLQSSGTQITVTTTAVATDTTAPAWAATWTMGTPTQTSVTATASALATDNVAVTGYEVTYNGGTTWDPITPSGNVFTLAGTQGTTYSTTRLRARDAAGNRSTELAIPAYTMASAVPAVGNPTTLAAAMTLWGAEGYWKLDETTGTIVTDYSGKGRHGTLTGTAGTDYTLAGQDGRLLLKTTTGKVTIPDADGFSITPYGFSIFATMRQSGGGGSSRLFISKLGTAGQAEWETRINYMKPKAASLLASSSPAAQATATTDVSLNAWHGIAFAIPPRSPGVFPTIWVDNNTPQDATTSYASGTANANAANDVFVGGGWVGAIGHVAIFPFSLTAAHVQKLMDLARAEGLIA